MTELLVGDTKALALGDQIFDDLEIIAAVYPADGRQEFSALAIKFGYWICLRLIGLPIEELDEASVEAIDKFICSRSGRLIVDNKRIYFRADRNIHRSIANAAAIIQKAGVFGDGVWPPIPIQDLVSIH